MVGNIPVMVAMREPFIVQGSTLAYEVLKLMDSKDLSCVLVISEKSGVEDVRVFNRKSAKKLVAKKIPPESVKVEDVSSNDYVVVSADTPIDNAIKLMKKKDVNTILVVNDRHIVGVATHEEIIKIIPDIYSTLKELVDNLLKIINESLSDNKIILKESLDIYDY